MSILLGFLWLFASLFVLVKSSDYFTDYSEKLGKIFGIPQFIIGITIIALGTSLPELASSAVAVYKGSSEIVAANVIGSNIANTLLVIGLAAIFAKKVLSPTTEINSKNATMLIGSTALISIACINKVISFPEAIFLLLGYLGYVYYSIRNREKNEKKSNEKMSIKIPLIIILSSIFIYFGAEQTISSLIYISNLLNISEAIISLTVIAIGTSLPEAVVSIAAARKGNYDIALGNIVGSNMFNVLFITGVLGIFKPLSVSIDTINIGIPFLCISILIFLFSLFDNKIQKSEGVMFVLLYIFFVYNLFA